MNNYQDIEKYEIEVYKLSDGLWLGNTHYCDGDLFDQSKLDS